MNPHPAVSRRTLAAALVVVIVIAVAIAAYYLANLPSPTRTQTQTAATQTYAQTQTQAQATQVMQTMTTITSTQQQTIATQIPVQKPRLHTQILFITVPDEMTRIAMYKAGIVDVAQISPTRFRDINMTPVDGHRLILTMDKSKLWLVIDYVQFNVMKDPFNITEVRQALTYAVPYDTILNQVYGGLYVEHHSIVPRGVFGWTDYNIIKYNYNITKAKEILGKLKQERGFDPSKYTITISYPIGFTNWAQVAALLQNSWSQLGFRVLVETYSISEFLDKIDHFNFDVAILSWTSDYPDPDNNLMAYVWGGAEFKEIKYYKGVAPSDVGSYISRVERWVETEDFIVVVGPKGSGATYTGPTNKPLIVVSYVLDEEKTNANWGKPIAWVTIGAAGWRDVPTSAIVKLSRMVLDPEVRKALVNAAAIVFNNEAVMIILGQEASQRNYGSWVQNMYYPYPLPALARFDLVWESPDAPVRDTGILGIKNDPETFVFALGGWPDTFDTAKSYEGFGWRVFAQIYSRPITYHYEETEPEPDVAAAWAFSEDATELYLVIRGGVVAYDPWNNKTYPINAVDVLFSMWRVARLNLPGSGAWLIKEFIDVNSSQVLSEDEFKEILGKGLVTVYRGKEYRVSTMDDLLKIFNYQGATAGVVKLKLYFPYPPILHILNTPPASVISMRYALGDNYEKALADSNNGKNPSAWAKYVIPGEDDPSFRLLKDKPISTGPYYVADYKEDSYILMKINKYYWNAKLWEDMYGYKP